MNVSLGDCCMLLLLGGRRISVIVGQSDLNSEFQDSCGYVERLYLKNTQQNKPPRKGDYGTKCT